MDSRTSNIGDYINKKKPLGIKNSGEPYKVVVVDDSKAMRMVLIQILKSELFEIIGEASTGTEAVAVYKEAKPDLVTLDIHMPVKDGMAALSEILDFDKDAVVFMVTSDSESSVVLNALKNGAKGFIVKPPDRKTVIEKLEEYLNN